MASTTKVDTFVKVLKTLFFIAMILLSVYYSHSTFQNYTSKATSFKASKMGSRDVGKMPAIVICFQPVAKQSVLNDHNLKLNDFLEETLPDSKNGTWESFRKDGFYELNRDVIIQANDKNINEGKNTLLQNTLTVTKILSLFAGMCYKIDFEKYQKKPPPIIIQYLNEKDKGIPNLYITSEESAYGILDVKWINGDELKLNVPINPGYYGSSNLFKLKPMQKK